MTYYNNNYFEWQIKLGVFGGKAEMFKFKKYINKNDKIIDFGCGGGFILKSIDCFEKKGIEINETAREYARSVNNIDAYSSISEIEDEWANVIISNHALEHTHNPLQILNDLKSKLKKNGLIIIVVPQEFKNKYKANDINQHLYTWTPQLLGNLIKLAGLEVVSSKTLVYDWPPFYNIIYKLFGKSIFNISSILYCFLSRNGYQVITIGRKS